jgi:hypothetical protein
MKYFFGAFFLLWSTFAVAQDTLPNFSVLKQKNGTVSIQWVNDYGIVKQITVQRSTDTLRRFASFATFPNPLKVNGAIVDAKTKGYNYYYRIYVQLPEGRFFYTSSKKAINAADYIENGSFDPTKRNFDTLSTIDSGKNLIRYTYVFTQFVDSISLDTTKIRLVKRNGIDFRTDTLIAQYLFKPSEYVFTDKKSNLIITLPNAETRKYSLKFFDSRRQLLYDFKQIKESNLIMEKYNFYKSGWYFFEIFLEDKLFERHRFFISSELPKPKTGR